MTLYESLIWGVAHGLPGLLLFLLGMERANNHKNNKEVNVLLAIIGVIGIIIGFIFLVNAIGHALLLAPWDYVVG